MQRRSLLTLTTKAATDDTQDDKPIGPLRRAVQKFRARPGTYLLIPFVAAVVGWFTNWLAVQMIFYPINFWGIPLFRRPEIPLGLVGWQGIVPCKTRPMTETMVTMVTSQLLTVKEAFGRVDPREVAKLLAPKVPEMTQEIVKEVVPVQWLVGLPGALFAGLDSVSQTILRHFNFRFLTGFTKAMQQNIDQIFDIQACVVSQMMADRNMLGQLFRRCGQNELDFLVNSGIWFGFLLGLIQMVVALFWDNPWSLSIGGGIVGLATNWLALKWIFEPVNPTRVGPFVLQGQFLRRQVEVAKEFSFFFANKILTSEKMFQSMLTDPKTSPAFGALFASHFSRFVGGIARGFGFGLEPETLNMVTDKALNKLPNYLPVVFPYMDKVMGLEATLRVKMEQMTSQQFERVLHPIFEQDELTLTIAGGVLGFLAGLVQQGLETGAIKVPDFWTPLKKRVGPATKGLRSAPGKLWTKIRKTDAAPNGSSLDEDDHDDTSNKPEP